MARAISPHTVKIRELLDNNPDITAKDALPLLHKAGFEITDATFNVTKSAWKKARENGNGHSNGHAKPRKAAAQNDQEVSFDAAVAFVREQGGLAAAKETLAKHQQLIETFERIVELA